MSKTLAAGFLTHIASGNTSLCTACRITREDGTIIGLTDHVEELTVDGTLMEPVSAYSGSGLSFRADASTSTTDLLVLLDSASITEDDIARGLYEGAFYELFIVVYTDPALFDTLQSGWLSDSEIQDNRATIEARSLSSRLEDRFGQVLSPACRADLGDAACTVNLTPVTVTGDVTSTTSRTVFRDSTQSATGLPRGILTWTTGAANEGLSYEVKSVSASGVFVMASPMTYQAATGDPYSIYTGCNKLATTCDTQYSNLDNMRAEIFLIGSDELHRFGRQ